MIVNEHSHVRYTTTLKDPDGVVIPDSAFTVLTLTLYDKTTGTVINNRNAMNIKNTNNGTIDANGLLTMEYQPEDAVLINSGKETELHVGLFEYVYGANKRGSHESTWWVKNITKVTVV